MGETPTPSEPLERDFANTDRTGRSAARGRGRSASTWGHYSYKSRP